MRILILASSVLALGLVSVPASACRCAPGADFEERYAEAELVFFGVAGLVGNSGAGTLTSEYREFDVQGIWKGPVQKTLRIYLHPPGSVWGSCDYDFEFGQSYLVLARTSKGYPNRYVTSLCSGTVAGEKALGQLRALGKPAHAFRQWPAADSE